MHVNMLKVKKLRTPTRPFPEGWRGNEREQSNCALEITSRSRKERSIAGQKKWPRTQEVCSLATLRKAGKNRFRVYAIRPVINYGRRFFAFSRAAWRKKRRLLVKFFIERSVGRLDAESRPETDRRAILFRRRFRTARKIIRRVSYRIVAIRWRIRLNGELSAIPSSWPIVRVFLHFSYTTTVLPFHFVFFLYTYRFDFSNIPKCLFPSFFFFFVNL